MVQAYDNEDVIKAYEINGDFARSNKLDRQQFNESVANGYMEMGEINLEEANAAIHTNFNGLLK